MKNLKRKWFKTYKERLEWEAKVKEQSEKAIASMDSSKIVKIEAGPKRDSKINAKSKTYTKNGAKISPDELWLIGNKPLK